MKNGISSDTPFWIPVFWIPVVVVVISLIILLVMESCEVKNDIDNWDYERYTEFSGDYKVILK